MRDKTLVTVSTIVALLMLSMAVTSSLAFVYPNGTTDNLFELNGPHIDQILIKKYASYGAEMLGLQIGEIDITDWALTKTDIDNFVAHPEYGVNILGYGGGAGYYTFNFNVNNNTYLGNPQDPAYPNPINPNPTSDVSFRQAMSYLVDRVALCAGGLYTPIFTPIPASMPYWIHPDIRYHPGALAPLAYPPSVAAAAATLAAGHFLLIVGQNGGKRFWDINDNGAYDAGEDVNLIIYSRADKLSADAANMLCFGAGFAGSGGLDDPAIQVKYTRTAVTSAQAQQIVMRDKNYNMYTACWTYIGPDPDYLYDLYNFDNYYHPGNPPNFGAIGKHDPLLQQYSSGIKYAAGDEDPRAICWNFQVQFAATACEIPLASTSSPKAYKKFYTGGNNGVPAGDAEDQYRGKMWTHFVNEMGIGENSWWTTQNAYPANDGEQDAGMYYGDGNMIMRYGWGENGQPNVLNPLYSTSYWEHEVLSRVYDSLGARDPMTSGDVLVPRLAQNWTVGTWVDPRDGLTKAKIRIIMRPEILWSDGVELTSDDIIYTFLGLKADLQAKGCSDAWWFPTLDQVSGFYRIDDDTVDILMKTNAMWSMNQIVGNIIVPQRIWQPYITNPSNTVAMIEGDFSNQPAMLVGTGPFLMGTNTPSTLTMLRNPLYYNTLENEVIAWQNTYGGGYTYTQGITTTAVSPSTQISPGKIRDDGTGVGHFNLVVPVTNLNLRLSNAEHIVINIVNDSEPGDYVFQTLFDGVYIFAPGETRLWTFNNVVLPKGFYDINVTIEIVAGLIYDWVTAHLPPTLWQRYLGPISLGDEPRIAASWDVAITVPGDLNGDGIVDIFDIAPIAVAFGTIRGDPTYSSAADLNYDARIDIFDIVLVALNFGWSCPPKVT